MANHSGFIDLIRRDLNAAPRGDAMVGSADSRVSALIERRLTATVARQRNAIRRLQRAQAELTEKVEALEKRARSLLGSLDQLKDLPLQRQALQSQLQAARIQQVSGVVGNVQAAAFGEKGSFFTRNNLILAGNQLFWIFLDPVLRRLGVIGGTSPSFVTWLAPAGSLLTGQLALANQQHERFITGVSTVTQGKTTTEVLRGRVADGFWEKFQRQTDVAVSAVVLDQKPFIPSARVQGGVLVIDVTGILQPAPVPITSPTSPPIFVPLISTGFVAPPIEPVRVAWIVDTGVGSG